MQRKIDNLQQLDHRDSTILKGLAILPIVLHNFFHAVSPAQQNEFFFRPGGFLVFLAETRQPSHLIQAFFSFFGHLGVQMFIFLSAYGLARSHWEGPATWAEFMWSRVKKLYPTILLIVLPWLFAEIVATGPGRVFHTVFPPVAAALLGISTLVGFDLPPIGPWWFIPFTMQLYAMWFGLRWVARRFGWPGLLALAVLGVGVTSFVNPLLAGRTINLLTTPFGRMPSLCLGILAARFPVRIPGWLAGCGFAVLLLGNIYSAVFPLAAFGILLTMLWGYPLLREVLRGSALLFRIGECSLLLFLLNGIVRNQLAGYPTSPATQLFWGFFSAALSLALSNLIARLLEPAATAKPVSVPALGAISRA